MWGMMKQSSQGASGAHSQNQSNAWAAAGARATGAHDGAHGSLRGGADLPASARRAPVRADRPEAIGVPASARSAINVQSDEFGDLQRLVDAVFRSSARVNRLELIVQAEARDLHEDLLEIVSLLPPGTYTRQRMCDQLNSALAAHGWGRVYGTVE